MRKLLTLLISSSFLLTGCLETTKEITLNAGGSGIVSTTNDMGPLISIASQMGGTDKLGKEADRAIDSTISLASLVDSMTTLSPEDKMLVAKGNTRVKMNIKNEEFLTVTSIPFSKLSDLERVIRLTNNAMDKSVSKMLDESPQGIADMPPPTSIEDYYKLEFSAGELTRKLDKSKYESLVNDEYLASMKEMISLGLSVKSNLVINLPSPATKAEGKNVVLSADRKKVTISVSLEDFYEDSSAMEFKIKY